MATENGHYTANYSKQGGGRWVVGGTLQVTSGGTLGIAGAWDIAGTTVTPSAAEINDLNAALSNATFTVTPASTAAANAITIAVQLKDADGTDLAHRANVWGYLAKDATGDAITTTSPKNLAIKTDGVLTMLLNSTKAFNITSESDGDIDFDISGSTAASYHVVLVMPSGKLKLSSTAAFT